MGLVGPARATALGHATTAFRHDLGGHVNPATPATYRAPVFVFFARQGFGLAELRYGGIHGAWPASMGTISLGASTFGGKAYRETYLTAGFARSVHPGTSRPLHLGGTVRYLHTQITGYGSAGALSFSGGGLMALLPTLHFGVHVANLRLPLFSDSVTLPRSLAIGLAYQAAPQLTVLADAYKDIDFPLSLRGGFEYHPVPALALRSGIHTNPTAFALGVGVQVGALRADVAAEQHLDLGWTPSAALALSW